MKKCLPFLLIILAGLVSYYPSLKYGFSQDDFIHLYSSQANTISSFFNFFNPFYHFPDIFFFRPLTTQVYFFINQSLFGLNPAPNHIEALVLHTINSILFYLIIKKIWKDQDIALLSAVFYSISAVHFLSLYYISSFQEIGRIFFIFLSILMFLNFEENRGKFWYFGSLITFIASLLSKETSVILPLLIPPLILLKNKSNNITKTLQKTFLQITPFIFVVLIYFIIRFLGFKSIFNEGAYITTFNPLEIFQNIKWYLLWTLGLPEILSSWPSLRPGSLIQFGKDLPYGFFLLAVYFLLILSIILSLWRFRQFSKRALILSVIMFFISLSPVLILKGHQYPQYLDLAFLGFLPILAWLFYPFNQTKLFFRIIGFSGIILFIVLQLTSLKLSEQTHWTTHRAKVADFYHQEFLQKYPVIDEGADIIFVGDATRAKELSVALAQKYALQVWYPKKISNVKYVMPDDQINETKNIILFPVSRY